MHSALERINTHLPAEAIEDAVRQVTRPASPFIILHNRAFHRMVTDGLGVRYRNREGRDVTDKAWVFDFASPENNDWLVVNQFTVVENRIQRRADLVVFINEIKGHRICGWPCSLSAIHPGLGNVSVVVFQRLERERVGAGWWTQR